METLTSAEIVALLRIVEPLLVQHVQRGLQFTEDSEALQEATRSYVYGWRSHETVYWVSIPRL